MNPYPAGTFLAAQWDLGEAWRELTRTTLGRLNGVLVLMFVRFWLWTLALPNRDQPSFRLDSGMDAPPVPCSCAWSEFDSPCPNHGYSDEGLSYVPVPDLAPYHDAINVYLAELFVELVRLEAEGE